MAFPNQQALVYNDKVVRQFANQMPAQADKLSEAQIHVLASCVWGLSNKAGAAK